ncbi:phage tail tube protein [Candidatus Darwinibacter acetoxidans]
MSEREVARKAFGTKLKRGEVYVARLTNITPPELSRDDIDVTDHDSPDGFREFVPGLKQSGEVPLEGNLIPTDSTQTGLLAAVDIDEPEEWTIEFPTIPKLYIRFFGYVKSFAIAEAPVEGVMKFTATIKATGKPIIETDTSAGLTDLALKDNGNTIDLKPEFSGPGEYFADAGEATSVKVTPTGASHNITVNGSTVQSGSPSGAINLTPDAVTVIAVKAWEEGKAPVTYVIKVYAEEGGV